MFLHFEKRRSGVGEKERENFKLVFIDNQRDDLRSSSTTPLPGDTASGHSLGGEVCKSSQQG